MTGDDGGSEILLATKLFPPRRRAESVARPRLLRELRRVCEVPLALVVAPAGWGKSTVVMDWLQHDRVAAAWVSLDVTENDPMRFWRYLLAAVRQVAPEVGVEAQRRLDAAGSEVVRDVLPRLVNDLAGRRDDLVVVLDDLHAVTNPEVYEALALLLTRGPPTLHLIVTTRTDPPLPVNRLRLHGDLVELRAEHLRFTGEEGARLLNGLMGLDLGDGDVRRLLDRTEGWAAGLQLAGLSLSGQTDRSGFISRFSGMDRHLVDYLGEEVLGAQPAEVRQFLLRTSVLNRLSGPLCDAVSTGGDGVRLIEEVYRANLFLVPLDSDRRWFRYHYLFRELLRSELVRTVPPDEIALLHRRAASWYAAAGEMVEAVDHAIQTHDAGLAAELVRAGWRVEFNAGRWPTVQRWLAALPADTVAADADLVAAGVWIAVDRGLLDEAASLLDAASERHRDNPHLRVLHALHRYKTGDVVAAAELLADPRDLHGDPFLATVRDLLRGAAAFWLGEADEADRWLTAATVRAGADGNRLASIYALGLRALVQIGRKDLAAAGSALDDADRLVAVTLSDAHFVAMFPALARARRDELAGHPEAAAGAAHRALTLARRGAGRVELVAALVTAARTGRYDPERRRSAEADLLAEARRLLLACAAPGPVAAAWLATEDRAARPPSARSGGQAQDEPLTDRELGILRLLAGSASQRELADALFVSPNTLKTHLRSIYRKLGVASRPEAVVRARDLGLV